MSTRVLRRLRQEDNSREYSLEPMAAGGTAAGAAAVEAATATATGTGTGTGTDTTTGKNDEDHDKKIATVSATTDPESTSKSHPNDDVDDGDDDDDDEIVETFQQRAYFMQMAMLEEDSSDASSESSSFSSSSSSSSISTSHMSDNGNRRRRRRKSNNTKQDNVKQEVIVHEEEQQPKAQDFDEILSQFQTNISTTGHDPGVSTQGIKSIHREGYMKEEEEEGTMPASLRISLDFISEYNVDETMRNMLQMSSSNNNTNNSSRNHQNRFSRIMKARNQGLFARHRDAWGVKPNNFLGGGLGMIQQQSIPNNSLHTMQDTTWSIPWPYNCWQNIFLEEVECNHVQLAKHQQWYTFDRSSVYRDRVMEYQKYIANSGDVNAMAMFIADHPYVVEPLFHFSMFFFSLGENDKGMELLKRILWILESSCLRSFLYGHGHGHGHGRERSMTLMDFHKEENEIFFRALFWLAQTSCMVGCVVTSLALGRFLLSLDPWRDPMGILMVLDYFALATRRSRDEMFVVDLIDSGFVKICDKGEEDSANSSVGHVCDLREMPNWAYSYALAFYRLHGHFSEEADDETNGNNDDCRRREWNKLADEALDYAISLYPRVPRQLMEKNGVDLNVRSFQLDWPSVIGPLDGMHHPYGAGVDKITSVFVQRSYTLWNDNNVQKWLFNGCQRAIGNASKVQQRDRMDHLAALERYSEFDPTDYLGTFRHIPADANPLDPHLMDAAMNYTPNRRRFLRLNRRRAGRDDGDGIDLDMLARQRPRTLLGTGRDGMQVIDPDLPLFEIFWRSLMPWARVDGVPARTL